MPLQQIYIEEAMKIQTFFDVMICLIFVYFGNSIVLYLNRCTVF